MFVSDTVKQSVATNQGNGCISILFHIILFLHIIFIVHYLKDAQMTYKFCLNLKRTSLLI